MKSEDELIERIRKVQNKMLEIHQPNNKYAMLSGRLGELEWMLHGKDRFED